MSSALSIAFRIIFTVFLFPFFSAAEVVNENDAPNYWDSPQPYFDNTTNRDIVSTVGQSAILRCAVRNLGDRAVSCEIFNFSNANDFNKIPDNLL